MNPPSWILLGLMAGVPLGALAGGFMVWVAARARWIEREAQIEADREREAKLNNWREESIRRGMMHEDVIRESSARVVAHEPLRISRAKP